MKVRIYEPERRDRAIETMGSALLPVITVEDAPLVQTSNFPDIGEQQFYLLDCEHLEAAQFGQILRVHSERFGMSVLELAQNIAEHGIPIPVPGTMLIEGELPRHCRLCGCTEAVGCVEGCRWEGDVCSVCYGK